MKENWSKNKSWIKYQSASGKIILLVMSMLLFLVFSCKTKNKDTSGESKKKLYTCSMHPQIIRDKPGNCPICGMQLIEKVMGTDDTISTDLNDELLKPSYQTVISAIPVVHPEEKEISATVVSDGLIAYDTRTEKNISSRYSGRIEKLYIKYMYQPINIGDILYEIYSPEMITEQENFIYLISNDPDSKTLIDAAQKKLILLGMTEQQIGQLIKTKKPFYRLPVYSPYNGHIHESNDNAISAQMDRQSNMDELALKEGMYVQKGQPLFNVLDPHNVWALVKIYASDADKIKKNQLVSLNIESVSDTIKGLIDFIEPIISNDSKIFVTRVYLSNHDHALKVGMLLKASIKVENVKGIWLPSKAVLDLGKSKIVWIKKNNAFEALKVETGTLANGLVEIISGVNKEDEIATDAHYLTDSESFIKIKK